MKHHSLLGAAALVLVANGFALVHAARNRSGAPDAEVVLTNRELLYVKDADNTGVTLSLLWQNPSLSIYGLGMPGDDRGPASIWSNQQMLRSLGFDCSVSPSDSKAAEFYGRQIPRTAFVTLEYDGPAWRDWLESYNRNSANRFPESAPLRDERMRAGTRLVPIDAAPDSQQLRTRHPDRHSVIIVPAVIRVAFIPAVQIRSGAPARLLGMIEQIPTSIHVSKPFSEGFRGLLPGSSQSYRIHVKYGRFLDPWVTGVEFGEE